MGLKKLLSVLALAVGLVGAGALGLAPKASADDGPHGGYLPDTGACAGCHRAHTAVGPLLLTEETLTGLCLSCHDGSTATATNVRDGLSTGGARLAGGGFEYAWRGTPQGTSPANWTRTNVGVATHGVDAEGPPGVVPARGRVLQASWAAPVATTRTVAPTSAYCGTPATASPRVTVRVEVSRVAPQRPTAGYRAMRCSTG
jgi:predicted CXXCH cytochrome family protein